MQYPIGNFPSSTASSQWNECTNTLDCLQFRKYPNLESVCNVRMHPGLPGFWHRNCFVTLRVTFALQIKHRRMRSIIGKWKLKLRTNSSGNKSIPRPWDSWVVWITARIYLNLQDSNAAVCMWCTVHTANFTFCSSSTDESIFSGCYSLIRRILCIHTAWMA